MTGDTLSAQANGKTHTIKDNDYIRVSSGGENTAITLRTPSGQACQMEPNSPLNQQLDHVTQGVFFIYMTTPLPTQPTHCLISNIINDLPVAENPDLGGTGVRYGVINHSSAEKTSHCIAVPTAFESAIDDQTQGFCHLSGFQLQGHFTGSEWPPLVAAANQAGNTHPGTIDANIDARHNPHAVIANGIYDTGPWSFQISEIKGLAHRAWPSEAAARHMILLAPAFYSLKLK